VADLRFHTDMRPLRNRLTVTVVWGIAEADVNTSDEFKASYSTTQAVNELCPALSWQQRRTARHRRAARARGEIQ
jgi:hypothetical protein